MFLNTLHSMKMLGWTISAVHWLLTIEDADQQLKNSMIHCSAELSRELCKTVLDYVTLLYFSFFVFCFILLDFHLLIGVNLKLREVRICNDAETQRLHEEESVSGKV